jgi:hypothetical protein
MTKLTLTAFTVILFTYAANLFAVDFSYKKIEEFETLDMFNSVNLFESNYNNYTQDCLDNTFGGSGGVPCLVSDDLWTREVSIYYNKLMIMLDEAQKSKLRISYDKWLASKRIKINEYRKTSKYNGMSGTMYILMMADEINHKATLLSKAKALEYRKKYHDLIATPPR